MPGFVMLTRESIMKPLGVWHIQEEHSNCSGHC